MCIPFQITTTRAPIFFISYLTNVIQITNQSIWILFFRRVCFDIFPQKCMFKYFVIEYV
jgi:hypothetical protein